MLRFTARATVGGECNTAPRIERKKEMRHGSYGSHGSKTHEFIREDPRNPGQVYFSDHTGTLPGVHGAPAASIFFSSLFKSESTSTRNFSNCPANSAAAML